MLAGAAEGVDDEAHAEDYERDAEHLTHVDAVLLYHTYLLLHLHILDVFYQESRQKEK